MRAVNLIPAEQRGGASVGAGQSQGAVYAVLGMLAGVALLAVLYGSAHRQISSSQGEAARLTTQAQQAKAAASGLAPYTSFAKMRTERTAAVSTLVDSRFDWAHVFHEFGRVLPLGVSISSLEGTVGTTVAGATPAPVPVPATPTTTASSSSPAPAGAATATPGASASAPAVASVTPAGSLPAFTLSGCATTQREVAVMLERLRLIDGVAGVTLESSTKSASSAGAGTGTCPASAPAFTAHIEFDPLPAAPAKSSSTASVANTTSTTEASAK
jgi:Tfp pilus assembly protein PilN